MDKKIVNRIKGWAVVAGVLSLANLATLAAYPLLSIVGLIALIALILGLAVAYAGIQITTMGIKNVLMICWAKFIWLLVNLLYSIHLNDLNSIRLLILLAQVAVVAYLIWEIKKLPHATQTH